MHIVCSLERMEIRTTSCIYIHENMMLFISLFHFHVYAFTVFDSV